MPKKFALLALFLASLAFSKENDCAPLAFTKLSVILNENVPYSTWERGLIENGDAPELGKSIIFWQDHSKYKLIVVYAEPSLNIDIRHETPWGGYYIWIGFMNPYQVVNPSQGYSHMALLRFKFEKGILSKATLISPYDPSNTNKVIEETLDLPEFFNRTLMILRPEIE